jgi:hypothetical protein
MSGLQRTNCAHGPGAANDERDRVPLSAIVPVYGPECRVGATPLPGNRQVTLSERDGQSLTRTVRRFSLKPLALFFQSKCEGVHTIAREVKHILKEDIRVAATLRAQCMSKSVEWIHIHKILSRR